jgi:hypothetical protein
MQRQGLEERKKINVRGHENKKIGGSDGRENEENSKMRQRSSMFSRVAYCIIAYLRMGYII